MKIEKPFIIWTTQRSGGTNLFHWLMQLSKYANADHEPFLEKRCYGHVTKHWIDQGDIDLLMAEMESICSQSLLIKHCVGLVPWEISCSLMKVSTKMGYRHVFLHRKSALDRLLSLFFASQTGIWAKDMESFVQITGGQELSTDVMFIDDSADALNQELPIESLANNEDYCIQSMIRLWWLAKFTEGKATAVAFEDIYCSDDKSSTKSILMDLLNYLCLKVSNPGNWIDQFITQKSQGTRDKYQLYKGLKSLKKRLYEIHKFQPKSHVLASNSLIDFLKDNTVSTSLRYNVFVDFINHLKTGKFNFDDFLSNTDLELKLRLNILSYAVAQMLLTADEIHSTLFSEGRFEWYLQRCLLYKAIETDIIDCVSAANAASQLLSQIPASYDYNYSGNYNIASLKEIADLDSEAKADFSNLLLDEAAASIHAGCHFHLGRIALRQKRYRTARRQLILCLDKCPEHKEAKRVLSILEKHLFFLKPTPPEYKV